MKTNTTFVRAQVRGYILESIDSDEYEVVTTTEKEKIKFLIDTFKKEYLYPENLRYYKTTENVFINWLLGLPSCFNIEFTNYDIIQRCKVWGVDVSTPKKEDNCIKNFRYIILREIKALCKKHEIHF